MFRSSALQRHLWRHRRHADACVARAVVRIRGALDDGRLAQAVAVVAGRHETFRTVFVRPDGAALPMLEIGTAAVSPSCHLEVRRRSDREATLQVRLPATAADAVTLDNFIAEVAHVYDTGSGAGLAPLTDIKQYADVAAWHNQLLEDDE